MPGAGALRRSCTWIALLASAACAGFLGEHAGVPAAWLVGPMLVAIAFALASRKRFEMPRGTRTFSQAVIGTLLASTFRPSSLPVLADDWLPVSLVLAGTLLASLASGLVLARLTSLDGQTASLGTLPGAASGMLAMSPSLGADSRLVALMQYVRVVVVVLSATLIAHFGLMPGGSGGPSSGGLPTGLSPHTTPADYALSALAAVVGTWIGRRLHLPAGALVGPLILGALASEFGLFHPVLPPGVPQTAYVALGLYVGLLFDRDSLEHAAHVLPAVLASMVLLMAVCAGLGLVLSAFTPADPFTAYLATTPGGIDSVSIIALGGGADVSLVLAVQMLRVFAVVLLGPPLARRMARLANRG